MATAATGSTFNDRSLFIDKQNHAKTGRTKSEDDALGKNAFLTMMVAQLKNQDPMNPMEGTDFTAQLAQFSGLEQQVNMNDNLKALLALNQSEKDENNIFDYMGKDVVSNGNPVSLKAGSVASGGHYTLEEPAMVSIMVYNPEGVLVKEMGSGTDFISEGRQQITWDGTDEDENRLADGKYIYKIIARNNKGDYTGVSTTDRGMVEGVVRDGGRTYLLVNGRKVDPASVARVERAHGAAVPAQGGPAAALMAAMGGQAPMQMNQEAQPRPAQAAGTGVNP